MKYEILVSDRKEVVRKIEKLTGSKPKYTGLPDAAFVLDSIVIAKDNTMTADDDAGEILVQLISEHMIQVIPGTEIDGTDDYWGDEETENEEQRIDLIKPNIGFPMDGHRRDSIINLVNTIYSKGSLISKSTGGTFHASEELVKKLQEADGDKREDAVKLIQETEDGLSGISFEEDKVVFDGFPETDDPDDVRAWTALSAAINKNAIEQKHVQAKPLEEENEKYAFRTWITRIGMTGADGKKHRNVLYRNLSGHTAFRTENDREKWKAAQKVRKEKKRIAESAGTADTAESAGTTETTETADEG